MLFLEILWVFCVCMFAFQAQYLTPVIFLIFIYRRVSCLMNHFEESSTWRLPIFGWMLE